MNGTRVKVPQLERVAQAREMGGEPVDIAIDDASAHHSSSSSCSGTFEAGASNREDLSAAPDIGLLVAQGTNVSSLADTSVYNYLQNHYRCDITTLNFLFV